MMYNWLLLILFSLKLNSSDTSYFEGKVEYRNIFKSKVATITDEQLENMMGTYQQYYIKEGKYKTVYSGTYFQYNLYTSLENKLYSKFSMEETLYYNECITASEEIIDYHITPNTCELLGVICDELVLKTSKGTYTYYYSNKYKLNHVKFKNHIFGNWAFYTSVSKAIPLKIITENKMFHMESVAYQITEMELKKDFFKIPQLPTKPSNSLNKN
ncbi:hypothetical protein [Flavobacterium sp.]|uniref:hypothetical protein n=1 Tax=Flavobacterium sp. TaxID=239 RepID=UPI003A936497